MDLKKYQVPRLVQRADIRTLSELSELGDLAPVETDPAARDRDASLRTARGGQRVDTPHLRRLLHPSPSILPGIMAAGHASRYKTGLRSELNRYRYIPPKQKNIQGAFPASVPLLTATAVRLVPAPAQHMPANRSLGLRSWCAAPRPSAVLCHKDQQGMSLLHRRCVQLELCTACGATS